MSLDGKVRVVVRSRRVPARLFEQSQTMYSPSGIPMGTSTNRRVLYDYVLDDDQQRTIDEATKLAQSLCLELEVVDSAKRGIFGRMLSTLGRNGTKAPAVVVSPPSTSMTSDSQPVLRQRGP